MTLKSHKEATSWSMLGLVIGCVIAMDSISSLQAGHPEIWIGLLIAFSTLVLMPGSVELWARRSPGPLMRSIEIIAALLVVVPILRSPDPLSPVWATLLACPWLILRSASAVDSILDFKMNPSLAPDRLLILAARAFPAIGAAWIVAWCAGWMPFGFSPLIVLLTGAHFHHAGFTLPLIAGLTAKHRPSFLSLNACRLILAGVPLVAIGITCTHFHVAPWIEPVAAIVLVLGALIVGLLQVRLAFDTGISSAARACIGIAGLCLLTAMFLAAGFGLRLWLPHLALPMDQMWKIHGTLNALGFGGFGIAGWLLASHRKTVAQLHA